MKKISLWFLLFALAVAPGFAQESATQQQIDKLSGQIQDLLDAQAQQSKRLEDISKRLDDLSEKVNQPVVNDSASNADLKKLAAQVQEIDQKRQDDRDLILKQLKELGKISAMPPTSKHRTTADTTSGPADGDTTSTTPPPNVPKTGYSYTIVAGDSLSAIAKAFRDKGVKVTTSQILAANPGLDATKLYVGKKVFIPDANAK
ncbi:MAG TPA: LysM peptidoglycan-binding domain-containing protein [Verrucomicrobiae bacterium]|jgi:LysM repeat protein